MDQKVEYNNGLFIYAGIDEYDSEILEIIEPKIKCDIFYYNCGNKFNIDIIKKYLPESIIHHFTTGTKAWTWKIPKRWELLKATIKSGEQVLVDSD